jgi:hypothetical protein
MSMALPPPAVCRLILKLHAMCSSPNANEASNAREKLNRLLAEHGLTENDLPTIRAAVDTSPKQTAPTDKPEVNVLHLVLRLTEMYVAITPAERMASALWTLHCWVFDQFTITPRLALLSPIRECGKTTLVNLIEALTDEPYKVDDVSAPAIYHQIDRRPRTTLLIDEVDNLSLRNNRVLCSVFNSGHRKGGGSGRFIGGWTQKYPTFAPLCVAAIGMLPLPLMSRAIVINMQRAPADAQLQQLDENDPSFPAARDQIRKWAATCSLARNPEMPSSLHNRAADNWRVLFAIADDLGAGDEARAAALELSANRLDEDPGVVLLTDIRSVFLARGVDRITSAALVAALLGLDDGLWNEWRGRHDNRAPRKLTQAELSRLLRPFGIRPKTIWPLHRGSNARSSRGYMRSQFESAWASYCQTDTPKQPKREFVRLPLR